MQLKTCTRDTVVSYITKPIITINTSKTLRTISTPLRQYRLLKITCSQKEVNVSCQNNKQMRSTNTHDLSPLPYIPISWESVDFFVDLPNVMMS